MAAPFWVAWAGQSAARPASVLLLLPQQAGTPAALEIERGVRSALTRDYPLPVDFRVEYLDLTDPAMTPHFDRMVELLAAKYRDTPIDVVVAHRPEALAFAIEHRTAFHEAPVVFVEVTRPDAIRMVEGQRGVTGALSEYDLAAVVSETLGLVPEARLVALAGGSSEFDRRARSRFREAIAAQPRRYEAIDLGDLSFEAQLDRVSKLPPEAVVLLPTYRTDASGRSLMPDDRVAQLAAAASVPMFGFSNSWLGRGIVGGILVQQTQLGDHAGQLVARILNGADPASIPFDARPALSHRFDARALTRWHIPESRLPAGAEVLYRPPSLWADHRATIITGLATLAGQGALIVLLLAERRRRQGAQEATREAEQRYRTIADSTVDCVYWLLPDGTLRYVSPASRRLTGYGPDEFLERPSLLGDLVVPEDRGKLDAHRERARTTLTPAALELRIVNKAGEVRWVEVVEGPVVGANGDPLGISGSARDITDRKRAEADLRAAFDEIARLRDQLEIDNTSLREQVAREPAIEGLLGTSEVMSYVTAKARQVAHTSSTVLLLGETGVGKSHLARAIHELSPRRTRPLVMLDCAALPPSLVESELFGHERGAFTGAHTRRIGRFEAANGGTLFLDEIGELPLELQAKLLRAVQDGAFERVGSSVPIKTDVRLIAATNADLQSLVRAGRFRQDLWYRLHVFPITVPPLRQRPDDIPVLVAHFVDKHCRKLGRPRLEVTRATMKWLQARAWPGNIRELDGLIERSVIQSNGTRLEIEDGERAGSADEGRAPSGPGAAALHGSLQQIERQHILATLERLGWRIEGPGGAAEVLGLPASTLRSRMKKLKVGRTGHRQTSTVA
jgi:PAS domain S-box-containing protein